MNVYIVRLIETKEAVGIFFTKRLADLWWEIDEIADPGRCEYRPITKAGALHFGKTDAKIGVDFPADEHGECPEAEANCTASLKAVEFSETLGEWFLGEGADARWTRMPCADEPGGGVYELCRKAVQDSVADGELAASDPLAVEAGDSWAN